jgi:hypothetical protein
MCKFEYKDKRFNSKSNLRNIPHDSIEMSDGMNEIPYHDMHVDMHSTRGQTPFSVYFSISVSPGEQYVEIKLHVKNRDWILFLIGDEDSWGMLYSVLRPRQRRFRVNGGLLEPRFNIFKNKKKYTQFQTINLLRLLTLVQRLNPGRPFVFRVDGYVSGQPSLGNDWRYLEMIRQIVRPYSNMLVLNQQYQRLALFRQGIANNNSNRSNRSNSNNNSNRSNRSNSNNNNR